MSEQSAESDAPVYPENSIAVEELATLIQETFPTGAGGYSLVWEDCFPAARAILAASYTRVTPPGVGY